MSSLKLASKVKNFISAQSHGVLSTLSVSHQGYPFGSVVPYDIDAEGRISIFISLIAEHYKNLMVDSHASLTVQDSYFSQDAQAAARGTILLDFKIISAEEKKAVCRSYELRFPQSKKYELEHNFVFMQGAPLKIRWIGGFGDIAWVSGSEFSAAPSDPLAYVSQQIISHMNEDHHDALVDYVRGFSNYDPLEFQIQMIGISSNDFTLLLRKAREEKMLKIPFLTPLADAGAARKAFISMLKMVREKS